MKLKVIIPSILILVAASCNLEDLLWVDDDKKTVSIIRLIGSPDDYHNESVRIEGFLHLEFEGNAVYLHKEDFDRSLLKNGLWVSFPDSLQVRMEEANDQYVLIEGTFDMKRRGHFGLFAGEIKDITRVMVLRDN